jgi:hypothetical protein
VIKLRGAAVLASEPDLVALPDLMRIAVLDLDVDDVDMLDHLPPATRTRGPAQLNPRIVSPVEHLRGRDAILLLVNIDLYEAIRVKVKVLE